MITARGSDDCPVAAAVVPKLPVMADTQGRLRVTKAQRRKILAALMRSGESVPRFAQRTGIKYSTLARWVQQRRPKLSGRKPPLRLLEAVVASSPPTAVGSTLVLQLPGGVRVEVGDERQAVLAAALLRSLSQPC